MKKVLALVLAVIMLMAGAAAETVNTKETIKVGVVQLVDMADSDSAYEGMLATIAEAGLSDKIIVERQSAAGDAGTMTTIIQGFVDGGYDPIYGARPLKRYIQQKVETLVARHILADDPAPGETITLDAENGTLLLR